MYNGSFSRKFNFLTTLQHFCCKYFVLLLKCLLRSFWFLIKTKVESQKYLNHFFLTLRCFM